MLIKVIVHYKVRSTYTKLVLGTYLMDDKTGDISYTNLENIVGTPKSIPQYLINL